MNNCAPKRKGPKNKTNEPLKLWNFCNSYNMKFKNFAFLFSSLFLLFACGEKTVEQPVENAESATPAPVGAADTVTLSDIPLYGSYAEMQHIFEQKNDTTYVINFWATWCKPCVAELPYFADLHEKFPDEKLRVILVSLDFPNKLEKKLVPFINKNKLKSDVVVLLDGSYNNWIDKVNTEWDGNIPVTHIYRNGETEFVGRAFENSEELSEMTEAFLKK